MFKVFILLFFRYDIVIALSFAAPKSCKKDEIHFNVDAGTGSLNNAFPPNLILAK